MVRRAELLAGYQEDVVPRLLEILAKSLEYGDGAQLQAIALALDYLRDRRAARPLAELARDDGDQGVQALAALGSLGEPVGEETARAILADPGRGPLVREVAAAVLAQAGR